MQGACVCRVQGVRVEGGGVCAPGACGAQAAPGAARGVRGWEPPGPGPAALAQLRPEPSGPGGAGALRPRLLPLSLGSGMRRSPDVSPRRLSDISPQLRQLKYLVVDEAIKEDLKWSRSVEDLTSASVGLTSIEERILRITGYYGYQPWAASYNRESLLRPPWPPACSPAASGQAAWRARA